MGWGGGDGSRLNKLYRQYDYYYYSGIEILFQSD